MTQKRPTSEFVEHYRLMVETTGDDPSELMRALDEHPNLGASIKRLGEIVLADDRHRRTARHRYIAQAHPKFREAIDDFNARWRGPYEGFREAMYTQAVSRISGEFLQAYRYLVDRTGNDPNALRPVSETDPTLSHSVRTLEEISATLNDRHKEFAPFLPDAPGEFREALMDFSGRWSAALAAVAAAAAVPLDLESI